MDRWTGRVAVVTGASSGIGAEVVKELVGQGLVVVGLARRVERIQKIAEDLREEKGVLHSLKADLTVEQDIVDAFKWIQENTSGVDILINNAGTTSFHTLTEEVSTVQAWKNNFDLNVIGASICTREAVRLMKSKNLQDGIIININSISGHRVVSRYFPMYTASKFAMTAMSECLKRELSASGSKIRVTNLCPGAVHTEFGMLEPDFPSWFKLPYILDGILLPSDIAHAVKFVLSTDPRVHIKELIIQQNFDIVFNEKKDADGNITAISFD
uniref:Dehydrogenase/reductase SDR family member 11 n=1 Tax=Clastoptera arizonana TaxID=38151 RepID=A0A1B6DZK4_9HEMI